MTAVLEPTTAAPAAEPARSVWRSRGLVALFTASTSARLAHEAARVAMALLVLDRTGSPALVGGVMAALTVPSLVTGPVLGAWLDRTPRRRLAFVANQVLLTGSLIGLLLTVGSAPEWVVLALALTAGLTSPVLTGGFTGLIAPLVPSSFLRRAYGAEATSYNVAGVAGPGLAGTLAAVISNDVAVAVTAALSAAALLAVLRVPMPPPVPDPDAGGLLRTVGSGLRHLAITAPLRSVTVATTTSFIGFGAMPVVFPLLAQEVDAPAAVGGYLFSTFAIGAVVGSLVIATRPSRTGPMRMAYRGILGLMIAFTAIAFAPNLPLLIAAVAVAGALEGPVLASTLTVRELHSPASMRTQVVTTAASLKFGAFAVGAWLTGVVAESGGGRAGVMVAAGAQLLGLVLGLIALGRLPRLPRLPRLRAS